MDEEQQVRKSSSLKQHEGSSFGKKEEKKVSIEHTEESNDLSRDEENDDIEDLDLNQKTFIETLLTNKIKNRTLN